MTPNQSQTKCPKCEKSSFELVEDYPTGSAWKMMYIRCSTCKTFLQALYMDNVTIQVANLQNDIKIIKEKLGIYL
jgi:DNA polymerase III alpha subunit (gram-positive type)